MQLEQHRRRSGEVRCRHRGAAKESPTRAIARAASTFANAGDRTQHVDTDRCRIRLDEQIRARGALAAKAGQDVLVGGNELLERGGRCRCSRAGLTKCCPFVQPEHKSPAIVAPGAIDSIVPAPGPALPAATATTMPAAVALFRPATRSSIFAHGVISPPLVMWQPPPRERFRTSIPSAIAVSTALRMSSLRALTTSPGKTL